MITEVVKYDEIDIVVELRDIVDELVWLVSQENQGQGLAEFASEFNDWLDKHIKEAKTRQANARAGA